MSLAAILILCASVVIGGSTLQHRQALSEASIYLSNGQEIAVRVHNGGAHFCPQTCQVIHRHRVHDIRWVCAAGEQCQHFRVYHLIQRRGDPPPEELILALRRVSDSVDNFRKAPQQ